MSLIGIIIAVIGIIALSIIEYILANPEIEMD
jgi:hypothetical protein